MTTTLFAEPAATDGRPAGGKGMPIAKQPELTDREKELLRGVMADRTYPQIANDMGISLETVKCYSARIRAKLGVESKVGMALWAQKHLKGV